MAVYTIGDGWTGALGTGSLESFAAGHDDQEEPDSDQPFKIHDGPVTAAAAGWGHTAFVSNGDLHVCGRPHELSSLLRLKRFPKFMRMYAVNHALKYNNNDDAMVASSPSFAGKVVEWLVGSDQGPDGSWEAARRTSVLVTPTRIALPDGQKPSMESAKSLDISAGLTAVITDKGNVLTLGMNHRGQCGIGETSTNVWTPQQVKGLSSHFADEGRAKLEQEYPVTQVALGLQHGMALNTKGHLYVWGKAERGQLGLKDNVKDSIPFAKRLANFRMPGTEGSQQWSQDVTITSIAAGMNHSAARSDDNIVFVFGKNIAPPSEKGKLVQDSSFPIPVKGLPENKEVIDISCGSHHTAMLLEDGSVYAMGVATDDTKPILEAIELIPPGVVDMPVRQFQAHFDRTTIVGKNGDQVLQAHLWSDPELRKYSMFTPTWMDHFSTVRAVHRGWLHTVVVTDS
jgi:alpha-tubulin suppressor-like RCC1 family protein